MKQTRRNWLTKAGLAFAGIGLATFKTFASPARDALHKFEEDLPIQLTN